MGSRVLWNRRLVVVYLALGSACGGSAPPRGPGADARSAATVDTAAGGTTSWARRLGGAGNEGVVAIATGSDGSTTALTWIGAVPAATAAPDALGLVRLDRSGAVVWSRELPNPAHSSFFDAAIAV